MAYHHGHKASSFNFGSAQLCARREFFCPRGLKEGVFLEDAAAARVLHSTYRATLYLTATIASVSPSQDPSNKTHFASVPRNADQFIRSRRNINASNGSICIPENVPGIMEGQGVDCLSRVHDTGKRVMVGGSNVQQEQENNCHVSTSFDDSLVLSSHQEAALTCLRESLQNSHDPASLNLTSLQTFHIGRAFALHIDEARKVSDFSIEDPEAPSTPDLQPEVRSWDCEALCAIGVNQMPPADNLVSTGANDLLPVDNPCSEDADDMCLLEEEVMSTCAALSNPSYKCSGSSLCDYRVSANSKQASRKLDSSVCRQYMVQRLYYCLMNSALSIFATPNNMKSHPQFLHALWSFPRLIRLLKREGLDCKCEQCWLADIQIYLQIYKPRLIPAHKQKAMEVSTAACYSKQLAQKQVHSMAMEYAGRNGHHPRADIKMIVQEQVLAMMLQTFSLRYLSRRSGKHFWLRCLYVEEGSGGNCELNQCSSILSSKVVTVSAPKLSNLLKIEDGKLPRSTKSSSEMMNDFEEDSTDSHVGNCELNQCSILSSKEGIASAPKSSNLLETEDGKLSWSIKPSSEMMNDFEEDFTEPPGSSSWSQENGLIRRVEEVEDWKSIPIEQVGECLDTCLQALPSAFPSDLKLSRNQPKALHIKYSNAHIINEGCQGYPMCAKDNRHEASCLPMSAVDRPRSLTFSQCGSREELRSSMLNGGVQERQSREKLQHFAEGFLLRRHIIQQQRRAQQAPPYPCRESAGLAADEKGSASTGLLAGVKPNPHTHSSTNASMKSSENRNHEPTMILTPFLSKPCDVTSGFCDHDNFVGADVVIDIVELIKYLESQSSRLEMTDAAANSIGCTDMPFTGGELAIPHVSAVIVTIVAIMVYTKILLEGAFAWVGSRTQRKEEK